MAGKLVSQKQRINKLESEFLSIKAENAKEAGMLVYMVCTECRYEEIAIKGKSL